MGIQGEGEVAFPALIERIEQGTALSEVCGLFLRGKGLQCKGLEDWLPKTLKKWITTPPHWML